MHGDPAPGILSPVEPGVSGSAELLGGDGPFGEKLRGFRPRQEQIDQAAAYASQIVIGYGLCSNGIVGVIARKQGLYLPHCHDCIAFFMGSHRAYLKAFEMRPGTYYLTPGWVAEKKDPALPAGARRCGVARPRSGLWKKN